MVVVGILFEIDGDGFVIDFDGIDGFLYLLLFLGLWFRHHIDPDLAVFVDPEGVFAVFGRGVGRAGIDIAFLCVPPVEIECYAVILDGNDKNECGIEAIAIKAAYIIGLFYKTSQKSHFESSSLFRINTRKISPTSDKTMEENKNTPKQTQPATIKGKGNPSPISAVPTIASARLIRERKKERIAKGE